MFPGACLCLPLTILHIPEGVATLSEGVPPIPKGVITLSEGVPRVHLSREPSGKCMFPGACPYFPLTTACAHP